MTPYTTLPRSTAFGSVHDVPPLAERFNEVFDSYMVPVNGLNLHAVVGGSGAPLLLLGGWPQTWYAWADVIPHLVQAAHEVIAIDMRGAGDSSRPFSGYDSDSVATDIHMAVTQLGFDKVRLVAHDNGARVAYASRRCSAMPSKVWSFSKARYLESKTLWTSIANTGILASTNRRICPKHWWKAASACI